MLWDEKYTETVFSDDFTGSTLDTDKWNVAKYKRDIGILIDSSATIKVDNGSLELTMISCPNCEVTNWDTTYYGNYAGGEVDSKVPPFRYGIFECRAKYATNLGSWPAFWIIGGDGTPCPPGGYGNEIDIAELKCQTWLTKMGHVIHRYYPPEDCNKSNVLVKDIDIYNIQLNNIYYDYKCVWTPNKISYYINNNLMHEVQNTGQEWYPELYLQVVLSQQIITASNISGQFTVITPQTSYFDKVSVKRFFATPEITCPNLICTTGSAIIDVDQAANNFTWSLTPASLFSGNKTGTGKTVAITATTGASGQGKITYSFNMPSGETFTAEKTFWVGKPVISNISGPLYTPNNQWATYYAEPNNSLMAATNYNWILNPLNGNVVYDYGWTADIAFYNSGTYQLIAQAYNTCGWGSYYVTGVEVYDYQGLSISPNPTTGETTLAIESTSAETTFDETTEWDLEIYDQTQSLKEKKQT